MGPIHTRLGMKIKELRTERGITQEALARKADISLGYVTRLENGRHEPTLTTLAKIAKVLKVKVADLLE